MRANPRTWKIARDMVSKLDVDPDAGAIEQLVQLAHASPAALGGPAE